VLNIKDPEAHRLARELAEVKGTTMTGAVTAALQAALDEHNRRREAKREVLSGLIAAARERGLGCETDPFAELYDPHTGLPA